MHHERGRDLAENHVDCLREFGLQIVGNDARFGLGVAVSHGETNRAALFESGSSTFFASETVFFSEPCGRGFSRTPRICPLHYT